MAAVSGIVNNHGDRITVESQTERGTIVRIWLPAFFEIEEKAAEKPRFEPNRTTDTIPMI
jgi:K+-sensing histidine kinase KdpD